MTSKPALLRGSGDCILTMEWGKFQRIMHLRLLIVALAALSFTGQNANAQDPAPRLVLLLTVDQGRGDYLERFQPSFEGGFKRLLDHGVLFTDAHHFHAGTVTAAGHASLSTGRYPAHSGMVGNEWYDRTDGKHVYCVEDATTPILAPEGAKPGSGAGRSPARLLTNGLGDWIQASDPNSKVFSIGAKDRSAVLMGGKNAQGAFWFDRRNGQWVTSTHYASEYSAWVREFHRERFAESYFGRTWTPLEVPHTLLDEMKIVGDPDFTHALGRADFYPTTRFYNALYNSPFIEPYLLDFAKKLVVAHELGEDESVDVLALSFASVDTVGHTFGPNSPEVLDTMLRLDRGLGELFDFLDERIGLANVAISLSADHGVASLPEYQSSQNLPGGFLSAEDYACFQTAGRAFQEKFGKDDWFHEALYFNNETLKRRDVERSSLESIIATELARCPSVERVWTRTEIENASAGGSMDPTLELYLHSFHPERSPDLYVQHKEGLIGRVRGTTHGSPYRYDTHVMALVQWPGAQRGTINERVNTVDLPVTIASLLGIDFPDNVDGVDRSDLIRD